MIGRIKNQDVRFDRKDCIMYRKRTNEDNSRDLASATYNLVAELKTLEQKLCSCNFIPEKTENLEICVMSKGRNVSKFIEHNQLFKDILKIPFLVDKSLIRHILTYSKALDDPLRIIKDIVEANLNLYVLCIDYEGEIISFILKKD